MWPVAARVAGLGGYVMVADMPGYGLTRPASDLHVTYSDWQEMLADLAARTADHRPLVLFGASMGGMLALDAAAVETAVDRVIVTSLLDLSDPAVQRRIARWPALAGLASALLPTVVGPLTTVRLPMQAVAPMGLVSVVLVHPGADRWTPPDISLSYLERLPVETRYVELPDCGHFPIEEPGFSVLLETIGQEIARLLDSGLSGRRTPR